MYKYWEIKRDRFLIQWGLRTPDIPINILYPILKVYVDVEEGVEFINLSPYETASNGHWWTTIQLGLLGCTFELSICIKRKK